MKGLRIYTVILVVTLTLDVIFSILLIPASGGFFELSLFARSFGEWVIVTMVRVPALLLLLIMGWKKGSKPLPHARAHAPVNSALDEFAEEYQEETSGLLDEFEDELLMGVSDVEAEREAAEKQRKYWKNGALAGMFIVQTGSQVTLGIQAVQFEITESAWPVLVCFIVLFINVQLFVTRRMLVLLTRDVGVMLPLLHNHHLYSVPVDYRRCDKCGQRVREKTCYNCELCSFDVCDACFKKAELKAAENTARSDEGGASPEQMVSTKEYIANSWQLLRPHLVLVFLAILFILGGRACTVLGPRYQGGILDTIINYDDDFHPFFDVLRGYILVSVASGLLGGLSALCFSFVDKRLRRDLRDRLFQRFMHQDIVFFDNANTGDLQQRLMRDVSTLLSPIAYAARGMIGNVVQLVGAFTLAIGTSWRLSVLAFTILGPLTMLTTAYAEWSREIYYGVWSDQGEMAQISKEALSNIRTVRAMSAEPLEEGKFHEANIQSYKKGIKAAVVGAGNSMLTRYMELGVGVLILGFGGVVIMKHGDLTVGSLITFQLYWNMLSNSFQNIVSSVNSFTSAGGAATRIFGLLHSLPDIDVYAGTPVIREHVRGGLNFHHVGFTYQARPDTPVLTDLSFSIDPSTTVAIVGASGGGKSTILQLLLRFYDPSSGSIKLDGLDLRDLKPLDLRRVMGYVSQDTELWNDSILRNITYGLKDDEWSMADVVKCCQDAHAYDFIMALESKWEERVGERGVRLSGGQKQRLAIARCLLRKPKLLFFDEATSALDAESESQVQIAIDDLMQKKECTIVIVAHRLSTVKDADNILVLSEGTIVEQGSHQQLLAADGVYSNLVAKQME